MYAPRNLESIAGTAWLWAAVVDKRASALSMLTALGNWGVFRHSTLPPPQSELYTAERLQAGVAMLIDTCWFKNATLLHRPISAPDIRSN